jgi:3-hydroxybutyrate dehydrogenase
LLAQRALGAPDILVNNAGIQYTCPIESFPTERWDAIIAVNLSAAFHTMKAALPAMRERGWGRVVNIASVHGLVASVNKAAYLAAKHGLVGLSKGVALETAAQGITVNCICPGWTDTAIIQPQIEARAAQFGGDRSAAIRDLLREKQPNLSLLPPDRIGMWPLFFAVKRRPALRVWRYRWTEVGPRSEVTLTVGGFGCPDCNRRGNKSCKLRSKRRARGLFRPA